MISQKSTENRLKSPAIYLSRLSIFAYELNFKDKDMIDFILIFRMDKDSGIKPSPEQVKERMDWFGNLAKQNKLADKGNTLSPAGAKTITSNKKVLDIPFSEGKEIVTGYIIITTETIEEAVEIAKSNPIFKVGGSIEVREIAKFIKGND